MTKSFWKCAIRYLLSFSISLILIIILVDTFSKNCIWRYLTCLSNVQRHQPPSYSSFYYCNRSDAEFALLTNCRFLLFQRVANTTHCFYCIHPGPRALNWALKRILTAFFISLFAMPNYNNTSFISHYGEVRFWSYRAVFIFFIPRARSDDSKPPNSGGLKPTPPPLTIVLSYSLGVFGEVGRLIVNV